MSESLKFLFLAAAYAVFWMGAFGYMFWMQTRLQALEKDIEALSASLKKGEE